MNRKLSETHLSRGESFWNVQEESYWKRIRKYVNKRKKINYRNERNSYEEDEKMIGFGLALAAVSLTACGGKKKRKLSVSALSAPEPVSPLFWRCAGRDR